MELSAHDLMRALVIGAISAQEFSLRFVTLWRGLRDSGQMEALSDHVQRGLSVVFTAIDSLDSCAAECAEQDSVKELLLAEVRAVYVVVWGDNP